MFRNLICIIFAAALFAGCTQDGGSPSQPANLPSNMKVKGSELEVTMKISVAEESKDTIDGFSRDIIREMPAIVKAAPENVKVLRVDGYMDAQNMYGEIKSSKMITATIDKAHAATVNWPSVTPATLDATCKQGNGKLYVNPGLK